MFPREDGFEDFIIDHLLETGYIEIAGVDPETGENTYRVTELGRQMIPELHQEAMAGLNAISFRLWQKDMIDLTFDDEGMPRISLNENSYNEEKIMKLPQDERFTIRQFVQLMGDSGGII